MIFHKDLTPAGIAIMCKKYFADQLQAGNYHFDGSRLMVSFEYEKEGQFYCLAEVHGHERERPEAKAALIDFLIAAFGGRI